MSLLVWLQSIKTLKLRAKLIAAFAGMAMMAGFCGIVGLVFVERIGASVSMFSDVTSPLLTESDAVVDNARRLRATVFRVLASGEIMPEKLAQLRADGTRHLQALRELAAKAKIEVALDDVEQYKREFVQILERMSEVSQQKKAALLVTQERTASFQAKRRDVDALLLDLANRAQGKMLRTEDEAKVQVQTGAATVEGLSDMLSDVLTEAYPIVQNTGRLLRQVDQIDDAAQLLLVQTDAAALTAVEQRVKRTFKTIDAITETLAGRLRDADGTVELTKFRSGILGLETALLGPDGLFERHRDAVTTQAERAADRANLDRIDRTYLQMVENIKSAVGTLNQEAQLNAANGITQAHKAVAASVVTTVLAGLAFGFFFAGRITRPLTRLTDHVVQIREKGELNALPGVAEAGRVDEIGMLSRSFNLMIAELADARRRLIAWSEAEIHTQYQRLNAAINNMPQGLCMFDAEQKLIICNRRYAEIYGLPPEHTVPGTTLRTILRHRVESSRLQNAEDFIESRLAVIAENKPWYQVSELNDGQVIAISHQPMADGGLIATHEDVTERRKAELQIAYMAHHDALTALPNRVRLREEMEKALTRTARGESVAVLCIDLDHFKTVNDTLGHPVGDALLRAASERLRACVRPTDTVARLGGDEFAIVQVDADQPVGSTTLASRLIKEMSEPFDVQGHQLVIGTSVGIAVAPHDGDDSDRLLKNADMALYRAKEDGRGVYRFFEPEMDAKMQARRALELDLRKALALKEFELFYQPLINLESNEVSSFEALLRWRHPVRGLVPPAEFIPLTEEIGLIGPIGAWVLKQACSEAAGWPSHIRIAVNLSPVQFKSGNLVLDVVAALGVSGLAADRLELEITETVLLQDTETTVSTLTQLRDLGARISMDDFGTGYSSLGYLQKFPFDKIKIDRSFIRDLTDKPDSIAIVRAVAGLGISLGMTTTAEGVETKEQLAQLRGEGCTEVQGFFFSEPKPAHELGPWLHPSVPATKAVA